MNVDLLTIINNTEKEINFEGKTSGIKNLQLEAAYNAVPIEDVDKSIQDSIVSVLDKIRKKIAINRLINQNLAKPDHSSEAAGVRRAA